MPEQVTMGAEMECSFGAAPATLIVVPKGSPVMAGKMLAATIMDFLPIVNIPTFGMCTSPTNPAVIAATAAALGTPTPAPCVPVTEAPWEPGVPLVQINKLAALNNTCTCECMWEGVITITSPGQTTVMD